MLTLYILSFLSSIVITYSFEEESPFIHPYIQPPQQFYNYLNYNKRKENVEYQAEDTRSEIAKCGQVEQKAVRECADPLYRLGVLQSNSSLSWGGLLSLSSQYFNQLCDNLFLFDLCIEKYKNVCFGDKTSRARYDTAFKVLDFLCRDGYEEMAHNIECFTKTLSRAEVIQCQAELLADTRKIRQGEADLGHESVCGAMRNYINCLQYPLRYECGYRALHLVRAMIEQPVEILLPHCRLSFAESFSLFPIFAFVLLLQFILQ